MKNLMPSLRGGCQQWWLPLAAILLATQLSGQGTLPVKAGADVPRTADGKPDLNGVYQSGSTQVGTWEEANQGIGVREPVAGAAARAREGPPYQPWAAKLILDDYQRRNIDSSTARCIPSPGFMTTGLFPIEFVQTPHEVVILLEYMGVHRIIPITAQHPDDSEPSFLGNSIGRWDGDTLVVDTVDFNEDLHAGGGGGRMHSDALHLTERFTRIDKNTIKYDVTWDDPKVLTRPDAIHSQYMLRPGTRVREYVCQENNLEPARYDELKKNEDLFRRK
jgi:hypothetical protein